MMEFFTRLWKKKWNYIEICFVLLVSLLLMRFIAIISKFLFSEYPSFRIMMGLDLIFVLLIPILVIFISADTLKPAASFLIPFITVGVIFSFCDVVFLDPELLFYPDYYLPQIIAGLGFGFIGLAGNKYHADFTKSLFFFTAGMGIVLVNSAAFIPLTYYVLTGDSGILQIISGLH
jgi:hypothetical protein